MITIYFHCVQLGDAIVRAVAFGRNPADQPQRLSLTGNLTDGQVANALIAGIALAAKSCGPPNHLSSSRWGPVMLVVLLRQGVGLRMECCLRSGDVISVSSPQQVTSLSRFLYGGPVTFADW